MSCGLRTNGTIACWGDNRNGQLNAPSGRFSAVSAGGVHSCGLRTDGTIACWGDFAVGTDSVDADGPGSSDSTAVALDVVTGVVWRDGRVMWDSVSGASSYNVGLCVFGGGSDGCVVFVEVECCSYGVSDETVTHVRVQAVNSAGTGAWSSDLQIRGTVSVPGPVSNVRFSSGSAVWDSVSGATSYTVRLWDGSSGRNVEGVACCQYSIPGGITQVNVRAVNSSGGGPWSGWVPISGSAVAGSSDVFRCCFGGWISYVRGAWRQVCDVLGPRRCGADRCA